MKYRKFAICLLLIGAVAFISCKKVVEQQAENFIVALITNNIWLVSNFQEGTNNLTADFGPYEFKFNRDMSVWGSRLGAANEVGTWEMFSADTSIISNFPSSPYPVQKLNGKWSFRKTTTSSVEAFRFENGIELKLSLKKK